MADITKIQEIFYELRVSEVMTRDVIAVAPDTGMRELQEILRTHRISGAPVLDENGNLVGVVSLADLIQTLEAGRIDDVVGEHMTRHVQVLYADERVISAIRKLQDTGYGRFPVVDRQTGRLTGILTQGDILKGTLKQLDIDYRRREAAFRRSQYVFEDIVSENTSIVLRYTVQARDFMRGGEAASKLKRSLNNLGIAPQVLRRIAIATYEAEMNLVLHTDEGGRIRVEITADRVRIDVTDRGPGIPDVEQAMEPGFSTAPDWIREMGFGAGMGLTNIQNSADEMRLDSRLGRGTYLRIVFRLGGAQGERERSGR